MMLLLASCGDDMAATTQQASATSTNQARSSTIPSESNLELAPDFSLAMGDGSTFTLAGENRPVYLLFWAEW